MMPRGNRPVKGLDHTLAIVLIMIVTGPALVLVVGVIALIGQKAGLW